MFTTLIRSTLEWYFIFYYECFYNILIFHIYIARHRLKHHTTSGKLQLSVYRFNLIVITIIYILKLYCQDSTKENVRFVTLGGVLRVGARTMILMYHTNDMFSISSRSYPITRSATRVVMD